MSDDDKKVEDKVEGAPAAETEATSEPAVEAKPKTALEEVAAEIEPVSTTKKGKGKIEYKTIDPAEIVSGMLVRVHQKIIDTNAKGEEKERLQVFQGMVIARKHGREAGATITVRKVSEGIGVERIYPLTMPAIAKIELVRRYQVRQARPYYLRQHKKKLTEMI